MTARVHVALLITLLTVATGCAKSLQRVQLATGAPARVAELWQEPSSARDLFHGPGGERLAPTSRTFAFVAQDTSGWSPGFDVRDANGLEWSVKLGPEAQSEVVTSRILWGLGYHQPPLYYLDNWTLTGAQSRNQPAGRFRAELPNQKVVGEWSWYENPFVGSPEYGGLIVANVMLNSWDWKTSNNKIYELRAAGEAPRQVYVVRDLGASLGKTSFPKFLRLTPMRGFGQGSRNDVAGFEEQGFIKGLDGERVRFHYNGIHNKIVETVTVDDVVWTCRLMARVSDAQWHDAFRAAGFAPGDQQRYIEKLKSKIRDGLALAGPA